MGHSPTPWRWSDEWHSSNVLVAADGDTIALYDMPYSRPRGEMDVANRALIAKAPEMAEMLREVAPMYRYCLEVAREDGYEGENHEELLGRLASLLKELPE